MTQLESPGVEASAKRTLSRLARRHRHRLHGRRRRVAAHRHRRRRAARHPARQRRRASRRCTPSAPSSCSSSPSGSPRCREHVPKPGAFFTYVGYGLGRSTGLASGVARDADLHDHPGLGLRLHRLHPERHRGDRLGGHRARRGGCSRSSSSRSSASSATGTSTSRSKVLGVLLIAEVGIVARARRRGGLLRRRRRTEPRAVRAGERRQRLAGRRPHVRHRRVHRLRGHRDLPRRGARTRTRPSRARPTWPSSASACSTRSRRGASSWRGVRTTCSTRPPQTPAASSCGTMATVPRRGRRDHHQRPARSRAMFACVLSFHNVITRYQHSMAERGRPAGPARSRAPAHLSPHVSSLVQTLTAVVLHRRVRAVPARPGAAGVHLVRRRRHPRDRDPHGADLGRRHRLLREDARRTRRLWNTVIAPGARLRRARAARRRSSSRTSRSWWATCDADGSPVFGGLSWFLLALIVVFPVVGYVQAAWIKARRPAAYAKLTDAIAADRLTPPAPHKENHP